MRRWPLLAWIVVAAAGCPAEPPEAVTASPAAAPPAAPSEPPPPPAGPSEPPAPPQQPPAPAPTEPPAPAAPQSPWVGLVFGPRPAALTDGPAIYARSVVPGSPADEAGIAAGDGILRVDGIVAAGPAHLGRVLQEKAIGDELRLTLVSRDGAEREVTLRVRGFDRPALAARALARGAAFLVGRMVGPGWTRKGSEELGVDVPLSALCTKALVELPEALRREHVASIDSAVSGLLRHLTPQGAIVGAPDRRHYRTYATALTLQSVARLADPAHADAVARLRSFLVAAQLDEDEGYSEFDYFAFGAWNYYDENRAATIRADVSATAYATEALRRAGVAPVSTTAANALRFLGRTQNLPRAGADEAEAALLDGGFAFAPMDSKAGRVVLGPARIRFRSYGSATADGLRALLALGVPGDDARVQAAVAWLGRSFGQLRVNPGFPPGNDGTIERGIYFYYLDGLTDALARLDVDALPGKDGAVIRWRDDVARKVISLQRADGSWAGDVAVMNEDDPAQATAFALLCLSRCAGGRP